MNRARLRKSAGTLRTLGPASVERMIKRIAISLAAVIVLALGGAAFFVHRQLPDDQAPPIEGLAARVEVRFDARGVPTISAQDLPDAFRVQGYLVARERLFQLELQRRAPKAGSPSCWARRRSRSTARTASTASARSRSPPCRCCHRTNAPS